MPQPVFLCLQVGGVLRQRLFAPSLRLWSGKSAATGHPYTLFSLDATQARQAPRHARSNASCNEVMPQCCTMTLGSYNRWYNAARIKISLGSGSPIWNVRSAGRTAIKKPACAGFRFEANAATNCLLASSAGRSRGSGRRSSRGRGRSRGRCSSGCSSGSRGGSSRRSFFLLTASSQGQGSDHGSQQKGLFHLFPQSVRQIKRAIEIGGFRGC